jgi:hypothetical protein
VSSTPTANRGYLMATDDGENARAYLVTDLGATLGKQDADVQSALAAGRNLLTNPGHEVWQRGAGPFTVANVFGPDRWQVGPQGSSTLSVSRDSANAAVGSQYCAACTYVHNTESYLYQKIEDYLQLRGRTLTFSAQVKCSSANAVRIGVVDTVNGFRYSAYHSGSGAYETLSVTAPINVATTQIQVDVVFNASCTAYVDAMTLSVGTIALPYTPLHAAEDLARCLRYYQTWAGVLALEFGWPGQCWGTTSAQVVVPLQVPMGGAPTVTFSAASTWAVYNAAASAVACTALTPSIVTVRNFYVNITVASGLVAGNATFLYANSTAARLSVEWNP